jgi:protein-disulfide isomerase
MNKDLLLKIGRLILSFLFVFGAVSKLVSMPFFDGMVAELLLGENYYDHPSGMLWIQWFTRILVAAELVLGIAILQNKWFKSLVLPATLGMLVIFTIHLFYEGFKQVNGFTEGNCGCFGDILPMTNLESIMKNVIGMAIGVFIWFKYNKDNVFASWVAPTFLGLITLFTLSFGVKSYEAKAVATVTEELGLTETLVIDSIIPLEQDLVKMEQNAVKEKSTPPSTEEEEEPKKAQTTDEGLQEEVPAVKQITPSDKTLQLLYTYAPAIESQNLAYGSKIVCLFSMTCSHCQEVYADLVAMKASGKLPDIYLVNYGTEYEQNYFFAQAGNVKSPHARTEEFPDFKRMLEGKTYPRILYVKDGEILKEWDVDTYEKVSFMKYYGIEKLEEKKSGGGLQLELKDGASPW